MKKRLVIFLMTLIFLLMLVGCSNSSESRNTTYSSEESTEEQVEEDKQIKENDDLVTNFIIENSNEFSPHSYFETTFSKEKNIKLEYLKPIIKSIVLEMYNEDITYQECIENDHFSNIVYNTLNEYAKDKMDGIESPIKNFDRRYNSIEIQQYAVVGLDSAISYKNLGEINLKDLVINSDCVLKKYEEEHGDVASYTVEPDKYDIKVTDTYNDLNIKFDSIYYLKPHENQDTEEDDESSFELGYEMIVSVVDKNNREVARYDIITNKKSNRLIEYTGCMDFSQCIEEITRIDCEGKIGKSVVDNSGEMAVYEDKLRHYEQIYAENIFNKSGKNDIELVPSTNVFGELHLIKVNGELKALIFYSTRSGYLSHRIMTEYDKEQIGEGTSD